MLVFLAPPSMEELEHRLRVRAMDSDPVIRLRLRNAREELQEWMHYDYQVDAVTAAAFSQGSYRPGNRWEFSAGLRLRSIRLGSRRSPPGGMPLMLWSAIWPNWSYCTDIGRVG